MSAVEGCRETLLLEIEKRILLLAVLMAFSLFVHAGAGSTLPPDALEARVRQVNEAQNRMMLKGSTMADVEALFSMYTEDFTYVHEVYGGVYTREEKSCTVTAPNMWSRDSTS